VAKSWGIFDGLLANTTTLCLRWRSSLSRQIPAGPVPPRTSTVEVDILVIGMKDGENLIFTHYFYAMVSLYMLFYSSIARLGISARNQTRAESDKTKPFRDK
jgi:hypothetical protein